MSKLLIVDDETAFCCELELAFANDHEVRTASNGREGIDVGVRFRPDVILSDWMLKDQIHGLHLVEVMRSVLPATRSILMTGFPSADIMADAAEAKVVDFIEKPFDLGRIRRAVQDAAAMAPVETVSTLLAVIEVGDKGQVHFANQQARELLAQTSAGAAAGSMADLFSPEAMPDLDDAADHWIAVTPKANTPLFWHLRSQQPRQGGRLVVIRGQGEPQFVGHALIEMLLGIPSAPATRWPSEGRVLVVDDEHVIRRTVVTLLEACGAGCYAAGSPDEALRLVQTDEGIEFVVHDFELRDGDAPASLRAIRAARSDIVIIGTSAEDRRDDFASLGVTHILRKPWQARDLINILTGRLGNCVSCDLPLPLRRPKPCETGSSWTCCFCGASYRAVFDDDAAPDARRNVRPRTDEQVSE